MYPTQFRAMFVRNCRVVRDQVLRAPRLTTRGARGSAGKRGRKSERRRMEESGSSSANASERASDGAAKGGNGMGCEAVSEDSQTESRTTADNGDKGIDTVLPNGSSNVEHDDLCQTLSSLVGSEPGPTSDVFHPVKCAECSTDVAVFDSDEVFHFYNVIPSYS
eukprot:TRINITY_DN13600_c0_g1_i1.p1 TRINITY_DN13600_c0_g1~~TRINITY_DN13600_c0_g1_i1.p1  ORF type:complete len:164 (-),score=27.31 TRINITY_DN13600_c0_g1_i1:533-1024(-)